jgi:hypothetical protein
MSEGAEMVVAAAAMVVVWRAGSSPVPNDDRDPSRSVAPVITIIASYHRAIRMRAWRRPQSVVGGGGGVVG